MCFDFVPAQGANLDSYRWVVLNQYSDTCYTSDHEVFCFESCYRGPFEIVAIATYDNNSFTCVSYRTFDPYCAVNDCRPNSPPRERPAVGVVYLEAHCGGAMFALKTRCTCVDYEYDIWYAQPADLSLPCTGTDTLWRHKHLSACSCDTITLATYEDEFGIQRPYPITTRATLPSGCCNAAVDNCKIFYPRIDTTYLNICQNCLCESSGCTVLTWEYVEDPWPCPDSNLSSGVTKGETEVVQGNKLTPIVIQKEKTRIEAIEFYDLNGVLLYQEQDNTKNTFPSQQKLQRWIRDHHVKGINIMRIIYKDGTTKVKKVVFDN